MKHKQYIYHTGDDKFSIASMKKYLAQKQEMDKLLDKIVSPIIAGKNLKILSAGCGLGHDLYWLNKLSPGSIFLGVDQTPLYIREAQKLFKKNKNISFEAGDVEDLPLKYPKKFDVSVSRAVISWIPYYDEFVRALMKVTKKHIFLSSLFYEGDIDFVTQVREFKKESGRKHFSEYRNVYGLPRFKKFVKKLGAKRVRVYDFNIVIDLPKGPKDLMGTYTEKLADGRRLQISGAVLMNWKWIRIDV